MFRKEKKVAPGLGFKVLVQNSSKTMCCGHAKNRRIPYFFRFTGSLLMSIKCPQCLNLQSVLPPVLFW